MKTKFFFFLLVFITVTNQIKSQDTYLKGGIGFYTLYESTFHSGKISISPTPIASLGLNWEFSDLFSLSWENSFRLKLVNAEYIGIDTVSFQRGTNYYTYYNYFNIDSKALGLFSLLKYKDGKIFAVVGTGISVSLHRELDYKLNNPQFILEFVGISDDKLIIFSNTGVLAEIGFGASYKKISLSTNFIVELFKAFLFDAGEIQSSLIQINIIYDL